MTSTARKTQDVEIELRSHRAELEQQLDSLTIEHDSAALQIAEGNTLATKKVAALKQQMAEVREEIAVLDAAGRALGRRKEEEQKAARLKAVEKAKAAIPGAATEMQAAWDKLAEAIAEMGKAWRDLEGAAAVANGYAWECQSAGADVVGSELQNQVSADLLSNMAGGLLYSVMGDSIKPGQVRFDSAPSRSANAEEIRGQIVLALSKLCFASERHAARAVKAISA